MDEKTQAIIALQAEIKNDEDSIKELRRTAEEHDRAAGGCRLKASELRRGLTAKRELLAANRAGITIANEHKAAAEARALAEQGLAEINAKKAELEAAIKKANEASAKVVKAAEIVEAADAAAKAGG